jgi:DnaK suppressor protein
MSLTESEVRAVLDSRRRQLEAELERLTRPPEAGANLSFGKRIGDGTAEAVERLSTTLAARSISASLKEVGRALEKLDDGSHGLCDRCGKPISWERLEAFPWLVRCVTCSALR